MGKSTNFQLGHGFNSYVSHYLRIIGNITIHELTNSYFSEGLKPPTSICLSSIKDGDFPVRYVSLPEGNWEYRNITSHERGKSHSQLASIKGSPAFRGAVLHCCATGVSKRSVFFSILPMTISPELVVDNPQIWKQSVTEKPWLLAT